MKALTLIGHVLLGVLSFGVILVVIAEVAAAGTTCVVNRSVFVEAMRRDHSEAPVWTGVSDDGILVEIFASETNGTWTMLTRRPGGLACIYDKGREALTIPPAPPGEKG